MRVTLMTNRKHLSEKQRYFNSSKVQQKLSENIIANLLNDSKDSVNYIDQDGNQAIKSVSDFTEKLREAVINLMWEDHVRKSKEYRRRREAKAKLGKNKERKNQQAGNNRQADQNRKQANQYDNN